MKLAFRSEVFSSKYGNMHLFSRHAAVWNDLFVGYLLPKAFEIFRLVGTLWYVYKDLIWRTELCGWHQIIFISGLFFGSDCFFDYTMLYVTSTWFYPLCKGSLLVLDTSSKISTTNWNSYPLETRCNVLSKTLFLQLPRPACVFWIYIMW